MNQVNLDKFTAYPYRVIVHYFLADGNRVTYPLSIQDQDELQFLANKYERSTSTNTYALLTNNVVHIDSRFAVSERAHIALFCVPESILDTQMKVDQAIADTIELLETTVDFNDIVDFFEEL